MCRALGSGYGSGSQRGNTGGNTGSEEARNLQYEGSTATGVRSGRTGATSQLDNQGTGTGTGTGTGVTGGRSGVTGSRTGMTSGATTGGVSEGFRGLNLTGSSGVCLLGLSAHVICGLTFPVSVVTSWL